MKQATLLFAMYDFTCARSWQGALQLKAIYPQLQRMQTAVYLTCLHPRHLRHANTLANRLQLPFDLTAIETFDNQLRSQFCLTRHGDNAVLLLDAYGHICEKTYAQAPFHAVQPEHLLAQLHRMNRLPTRLYPQNGRIFPTHLYTPA